MSSSAVDTSVAKGTEKLSIVPLIDFSKFRSSNETESLEAAKELFAAFKESGFVYLQNHVLPQEVVDEAFSWNTKFFSLPQEIKDKVPHPPEGWWHRGYSGLGLEKISQKVFDRDSIANLRQIPDVKESFEMGREDNPAMPNIWLPEPDLPGFRAFFNSFYGLCDEVKFEILRALAVGMELDDEDYFVKFHLNADNQTRILHYPAVERELLRQGKAERIAAHSDFGTLTLLFQDRVGGLEVEDPHQKGVFRPVPYIPGTCVVNVGDFLQMWSNDILKSTLHRVRAPPVVEGEEGERMTPERYSIPYFCGPDVEKTVDCVPGCFGLDRPKRYGPTTVGEYINMRMNAIY